MSTSSAGVGDDNKVEMTSRNVKGNAKLSKISEEPYKEMAASDMKF